MVDVSTTLQKTEFPVYNGYAPLSGGPKAIPISLDFTTLAELNFDLIDTTARGVIDFVQSIWVDNSLNAAALTLLFSQTQQKLVVPALAQGIWPVIAPQGLRCKATTTPGAGIVCQVILLNVPMPMTQYGPVTVNIAAVNASATPVIKNMTQTKFTLTGGDDILLAANAARSKLRIASAQNNANPVAYNYGAAAVLADNENIMPGFAFDSGIGPVSGQQIRGRGTAGEVVIITEG